MSWASKASASIPSSENLLATSVHSCVVWVDDDAASVECHVLEDVDCTVDLGGGEI